MLLNFLKVTQSVRCEPRWEPRQSRLQVCAAKHNPVSNGSSGDAKKETAKRIFQERNNKDKAMQGFVGSIDEGEGGVMNNGLENLVDDYLEKEEQDFAEKWSAWQG